MATNQLSSMPKKKEAGKAGQPRAFMSNIWKIDVGATPVYFKYDVRIYAIFNKRDGPQVRKELTLPTRDDYNEQERKKACVKAFMHLQHTKERALFDGVRTIYDRAAILFTTKPIPNIDVSGREFFLPGDCQDDIPDAVNILVNIARVKENFEVKMDLSSASCADFKTGDKSVIELMNLATSQPAFYSIKDCTVYGNGNIYVNNPEVVAVEPSDVPLIGRDKKVAIGMTKGVKIVAPGGTPTAALVVDVKKTAFHLAEQTVFDKLISIFGSMQSSFVMRKAVLNLKCKTTHRKEKNVVITIKGITDRPVSHIQFKDESGQVRSLSQYFKEKYNIDIRADAPAVTDAKGHMFPMEHLVILPHQRVKTEQADSSVIEQLIKVSAVPPAKRMNQTCRMKSALQLSSQSVQELGVWVPKEESVPVKGRLLPSVVVKTDLSSSATTTGPSWKPSPNGKFVHAASLTNWAFVALLSARGMGKERGFVTMYMNKARSKGMRVNDPSVIVAEKVDQRNAATVMDRALAMVKEKECTFLLHLCDDNIKFHQKLKLFEREGVMTQEVRQSTAMKAVERQQNITIENIVMKTNAKLGGQSHIVEPKSLLDAPCTMFLGLCVSQPRGQSVEEREKSSSPDVPAVIGVSANNGKLSEGAPHPAVANQYFSSYFCYANPKDMKRPTNESDAEGYVSQLDSLKDAVKHALWQYYENRGEAPQNIVVYRGGASEGLLPYIAREEKNAIRACFHEINEQYDPTFLLFGVSKEHSERFYASAPVDNALPGSVVDAGPVSGELNEFFLQSHKALQGTARATKYTLLHEKGANTSMDELQHLTYSLCHLHGVVNSTTNVPTPLYVAEESAKRGNDQFSHYASERQSYGYNLQTINELLAPRKGDLLAGKRFNA